MSDTVSEKISSAGTAVKGAASRVADKRTAALFGRNTVASIVAFGIDVLLLWLMVERLGVSYLLAATLAYIVAITLHYVASRLWIFPDSDRGVATGYAFFLVNAGVGLVTTMGGFMALMALFDIYYLIARVIASLVSGILVFGLNAVFNFKAI